MPRLRWHERCRDFRIATKTGHAPYLHEETNRDILIVETKVKISVEKRHAASWVVDKFSLGQTGQAPSLRS